jgi:hypothetical protein
MDPAVTKCRSRRRLLPSSVIAKTVIPKAINTLSMHNIHKVSVYFIIGPRYIFPVTKRYNSGSIKTD